MPVISMNVDDLSSLVGKGFSVDRFVERAPMIGASIEKIENGEISMEFFPNRPDLFSVEGVARAYKRFDDFEKGDLRGRYGIKGNSGKLLEVDPSVGEVRPVIGSAFIEGVSIDEMALISIMNLQEKLHLTLGRKRKKVAIGIHDNSSLKPPFRYWAARPDEVSFVPLQKDEEWDLARILKEHEKGTAYAWTLEGLDRYPVITDSDGQVLSFPPIINGELTRVSENTKSIFVDCTGWDLKAVSLAVNIVCSQMVDRGGEIWSVEIRYPPGDPFERMGCTTRKWPIYEWKEESIDMGFVRSWLGGDIPNKDAVQALIRMGYQKVSSRGSKVSGLVPPWRGDILHQADIAEDLAIGFGFERFSGVEPRIHTVGEERSISALSSIIKETLLGLGFLETRTISLSNEEMQFEKAGRDEIEHARIVNPITKDHTMIRMSAIPSLLSLLRANKHRDLPQRMFEVADIMVENRNGLLVSGVSEDSRASFTDMKGTVQKILSDLDLEYTLEAAGFGFYIRGRGAAIFTDSADGSEGGPFPELSKGEKAAFGHFGEIHPRMISDMELTAPVTAFELDLSMIDRVLKRR